MRLLSIGNSFSQDAHKWLAQCAASAGEYLFATNLFIGGCYLEKHWNLYLSDETATYRLEINGEGLRWTTVREMLHEKGPWDVITLQQASGLSGKFESYRPYLDNLYQVIRETQPQAKVLIHQTWSYEHDAQLDGFANYNYSQDTMFRALVEAYDSAARLLDAELIPSGEVIQYLRENMPEFDYLNGGRSLNRDGFHLSLIYGRYAVALAWVHTLFGTDVRKVTFNPQSNDYPCDPVVLEKIRQNVYLALEAHKKRISKSL